MNLIGTKYSCIIICYKNLCLLKSIKKTQIDKYFFVIMYMTYKTDFISLLIFDTLCCNYSKIIELLFLFSKIKILKCLNKINLSANC